MISDYAYKLLVASKVKGIGKKTLQELSADRLFFQVPLHELASTYSELRSFSEGSTIFSSAIRNADADVEEAERRGHYILAINDAMYPKLLRSIPDRPAIIYVSGNPARFSEKSIAIIGTREPSPHGRLTCERITNFFAKNGWQVVSGLAIGIDTTAHQTTVDVGGSTVAVLASGLETIYPKQNQFLAKKIVDSGGLLVSEYPYGTPSFPSNFVERDRIQAALSKGVVMIQSDESGGSWHASRASLRYNRPLIIPAPTNADVLSRHPKIRGNVKIVTSNNIDRATFLGCSEPQLKNLIVIHSRQDYARVESTLLSH